MKKSTVAVICLFATVVGGASSGYYFVKKVRLQRDALRSELDLMKTEVKSLHAYRYRSQSQIEAAGITIIPENNPYLQNISKIRHIKETSTSMDDLWSQLEPLARTYHKYGDGRDLAIGAMLIVAAFYDFGNPAPNDAKVGCVSINQNTNFTSIGDLTFAALTKSQIGCCTDFTLMLGSFLQHLGIDAKAVINTGHQAIKVMIDNREHFVDANNLLFGQDFFRGSDRQMHYFTPYATTRTASSQHYVMTSMAFGLEGFGKEAWKTNSLEKHYKLFDADFLIGQAPAIPN